MKPDRYGKHSSFHTFYTSHLSVERKMVLGSLLDSSSYDHEAEKTSRSVLSIALKYRCCHFATSAQVLYTKQSDGYRRFQVLHKTSTQLCDDSTRNLDTSQPLYFIQLKDDMQETHEKNFCHTYRIYKKYWMIWHGTSLHFLHLRYFQVIK